MKNFLNKIKAKFAIKKNTEPMAMDPHKHWKILLISFFVIIFFLILLSFYLLLDIKRGQVFNDVAAPRGTTSPIKQQALDNVTSTFDQKAQKENDLITNPPIYPDPSL